MMGGFVVTLFATYHHVVEYIGLHFDTTRYHVRGDLDIAVPEFLSKEVIACLAASTE